LTVVFSDAALDVLSTISTFAPRHVQEQTLPLLFSSLSDHAPSRDATLGRAKYRRALSALTKLCLQPDLFETLIVRLTTKLDFICVPTIPPSPETDIEPSVAYAYSIMTTIANALASKVDLGHVDIPKYIDRLVPRLFNLFIYSAVISGADCMVASDSRLVVVASKIIAFVVQSLPHQ
jgi:DNA repair/transcription protein MET18/MMS19